MIPTPKTTMLIRGIPVDLKDRFKAWCAKRGATMTGKIIDFMRDMTRRDRMKEKEKAQ